MSLRDRLKNDSGAERIFTMLLGLKHLSGLVSLLAACVAFGVELPPEVQVDRLLVQAERETREGEHWSAVYTLERALDAYEQYGMQIPPRFWFQQAHAYQSSGLHEQAVEAVTRYFQKAGREAVDYKEALRVLDEAEEALLEAARARAQAEAETERKEREAAKRAAAISLATPAMVTIPASYVVKAFEMSKYEITFAQWDVCAKYGPCRRTSDNGWGRDDRPVIAVSWNDVQEFVRWLTEETKDYYRLPSNKEWTHAASGGSAARYSWGRSIGVNQANCRNCGSQWDNVSTAPVGSFAPNAYGLHDMHGNVWEWVQNCYNHPFNWPFEAGGSIPVGSTRERTHCDGRMQRGGSFASKPNDLRVGYLEMWNEPHRSFANVGFRVVRSPKP